MQIKNSINDNLQSSKTLRIVLAGNPNVGKSAVFSKITGTYAEISNYSGTTLENFEVKTDIGRFVDTPGIFSLGDYNEEEIIAKQIITQADIVINVVNALSLDKDLFLTQQLIDLGLPILLVLNQMDEAEKREVNINIEKLSKELEVPVFPTVAIKSQGIQEVKDNLHNARKGRKGSYIAEMLEGKELSYKNLLENEFSTENREKLYVERRKRVNEVTNKTLITKEKSNISSTVGKALLNPVIGFSVLGVVLYILYQIVGVFIAGEVVDFLENQIIGGKYIPWITGVVNQAPMPTWLNTILVGEFGLLTMTIQYVFGLLLPLIVGFYFFMAILEDSGYLPRLAVLTDRFLSKLGLNGKAIIPIILGFGCVTMAVITTRLLGSSRERTIASTILCLTIPCSAQIGLILGILAAMGSLKLWMLYLASIVITLIFIGTVLNKILAGKATPLIIDLPPMRIPVIKNVIDKTLCKTNHFLIEATPLFFIGALIITILELTNSLKSIYNFLSPLTVSLLNLPKETANIFIMGLIRRDFSAAGLSDMIGMGGKAAILSPEQTLVILVVITLFVPCIATVIVLFKERGYKEASLIWIGSITIAFALGGILATILKILPV